MGQKFKVFLKFGWRFCALHFDHLLLRYKQNSQSAFRHIIVDVHAYKLFTNISFRENTIIHKCKNVYEWCQKSDDINHFIANGNTDKMYSYKTKLFTYLKRGRGLAVHLYNFFAAPSDDGVVNWKFKDAFFLKLLGRWLQYLIIFRGMTLWLITVKCGM